MGNFAVSLKRLVEKVSLEVIYTPRDLDKISVEIAEVNRPGLFLAGYYDYFDKLRLQIMGLAEMNFLAYPFAFGHSTLCHVIPNHVVFDPIIRIQYLTVLYMILFFDQPLILLVKSKNPVCFFTVFSFFFQHPA